MEVTAVEWFYEKIKNNFGKDLDLLEDITFTYAIAKQKEKQQIIDAWVKGRKDYFVPINSTFTEIAEQYYNETYGKQD